MVLKLLIEVELAVMAMHLHILFSEYMQWCEHVPRPGRGRACSLGLDLGRGSATRDAFLPSSSVRPIQSTLACLRAQRHRHLMSQPGSGPVNRTSPLLAARGSVAASDLRSLASTQQNLSQKLSLTPCTPSRRRRPLRRPSRSKSSTLSTRPAEVKHEHSN